MRRWKLQTRLTATAKPAAKDGGTMPLESGEGAGNKDLATSQQDVEAQQQGDKTAAAQADKDACVEWRSFPETKWQGRAGFPARRLARASSGICAEWPL